MNFLKQSRGEEWERNDLHLAAVNLIDGNIDRIFGTGRLNLIFYG
ncbi:hypothetical protein NMYAN_100101 [Nitrosomonas nitrosa]|uniref:Uncharacterized protein n=1 Tax=Nitrosomonas nitrosa TaxID=52442 RepID=A0A8H8YZI7_9PROT|nr:hypothetical protein NMYAN_100101 [Nitrosomonas nitrosa]